MDIHKMPKSELMILAQTHGIDFDSNMTKADLISKIELKINQEGNKMEEKEVVNGQENLDVKEEKDEKVYHLDNGEECSRSAYIRQEFNKDRSRQDIAKELGIKYYIVYSATANMFNAVHPENGGAGNTGKGSVSVPKVRYDVETKKPVFVNAEGQDVATAEEATKMPRADLMRELATAGMSRSEIKDYFAVPYATVYAATKDQFETEGAPRGTKTLIHPVTGLEVKRADYIRELYAQGIDRREIAKQLTKMTGDLVDYATVWAATKPKKEEEKKEENPGVPQDATPSAE